jgi:hypothetical protein
VGALRSSNTLEGFFSMFKRGLVETYQHVDEAHLDRWLGSGIIAYQWPMHWTWLRLRPMKRKMTTAEQSAEFKRVARELGCG